MLRRDANAILAAHAINTNLRELYVEGPRDKLLFEWLLGSRLGSDCYVVEIDGVEIADVIEGGNRARLIRFAAQVSDSAASIRCFADRDAPVEADLAILPDNVLLSDGRDLEGYVLTEANLQKVLKVGCSIAELEARTLLPTIMDLSRELAAMRTLSDQKGWALPFGKGRWVSAIASNRRSVKLDKRKAFSALFQAAGVSLKEVPEALKDVEIIKEEQGSMPNLEIVRGKDAMILLGAILRHHGVSPNDVDKLMWTSFDKDSVEQHPSLLVAVQFLSRQDK